MARRPSRIPWIMGTGALIGGLLATWLAPKGIAWYFTPPVEFGVNCKSSIEWALVRLQWAQLGGIVAGGIVALILFYILRRDRSDDLALEDSQ